MNPQCARCKKTVYPVEKLNCLDKSWHKACFNCEECHMTLTMGTYKGYNKLPYCKAHYPTTKFTAVADTPENRRLSKNTKQQSNLEYHKEYEKEKAAYTAAQQTSPSYRQPEPSVFATRAPQPAQPAQPPQHTPIHQQELPPPPPSPNRASMPRPQYVAIYAYTAAEDDEVSFEEGDSFTDCSMIDENWMEGTNMRTGRRGMLPTQYVEQV